MSQVTKAIDYTATTDSNGLVIVNGDIPPTWSDVTCVLATATSDNCTVVKAKRTGSNQVTYTVLHKKTDGTLEPQAGQQVEFAALLCGVG